jgi:hypothetical protein
MPMSTSSNISLDENDSFFEFKYPQDSRFRLRTTHWKISDKDLTDAGPSNVNINLDEKFGNVKKCQNTIYEDKLVFQCEECNRNFKNEKGLKIHRTRIHGLMGQSFLCESFSSKIDKTRRKNETIHQSLPTSMDYEKQSGSQDSQPDGSQRLRCTLCPGKSFKDNNTLKIHVDKYHVDNNLSTFSTSSSTDSITKLLINLKLQLPTIRRIPKACRHLAADKLSSIINNCLSTKSVSSFENLLLFSYRAFNVAEKSDKSLNKHIKENLSNFEVPQIRTGSKKRTNLSLAKKVEAKVADFDIRGAVKLLSSDDSLASFNEDVAEELKKKKHPSPSRELFFPDPFKPGDISLIVNEQNVREAINSFPAGSSPGLDGMRPQYLKDIISLSAGEAGQKALRALTKLCNFLLSGQLPSEICHLLYGASLCALNKKDGGIRPIAIGNCLRRLTSKLACFQSRNIVNSYLSPHQLGVATKLGCEAAIHTTRTFVNNDQNRGKVLLKLDFKNAFNSVERDCILKEVQCHTPLLYPYLYQCYRNPSTLFFGNHLISSSVGAQQGDPCGPMIFSLAIQPIILSLDSQMNIWYLDDGTLADYPEVVLSDFKKVINLSQEIGLELNFNKCEIFCCSRDTDLKVIKEFQNLAPGIKICDRESLSLLGSPIFDQGFKNTVEKTIITVENLLNKAELLNRHVAYTLIKNCLFIPKFNFLLRTTPFWKFSNYVSSIDSSLKSCLERILNLRLTDLQWRQSTLPIRFGGLGIRRISDICLPAFLSSINGVKKLVSLLLNSKDNELNIHHYDEALAAWGVANENEIPTIPQFQKNWDNINIKGIIANDLIFNSPRDLARFKALQCRESGSWLHAIPSPNIGTLLDNTSFQVCIGLRLGCNLCTPHICKCNAKVDEIGTHGLSCFKSSGRFSRHTEINSIINRSLTSIHVNSTLEPNGLSRDDGKRPDGMTLVPWIKGQPLVWDVTVVDTLADSYVLKSSEVSGFAAEMACKRKHSKYSSIISSNYVFKGLAFETLGPWCKEAIDFINVIGDRLIAESGDSKSKKFLFERISLAIQRGNAASIRGTFPDSAILSEIFVL